MNHSEFITHRLLLKGLEGTPLSLLPQQPLQAVLDPSDLPLTRAERSYWKYGSFDFVAVDETGFPAFAVDFDGPNHRSDRKQRADLRKMAICSKAHLPIAKIDDDYLIEREHFTIVEFMVTRFWKWKTEYAKYEEEFVKQAQELAAQGKSAEEIQDFLTPPDLEFEFAYPYPGIEAIQKRLREEYNLLPDYLAPVGRTRSEFHMESKLWNPDQGGYIRGYARYRATVVATRGTESIPIDWIQEAWTRAKWTFEKELEAEEFTTYFGKTAMELNEQMRKEYGLKEARYCTSFYSGLPGLSVPDITEILSEYKCLSQIEQKAHDLKKNGWSFINGVPLDAFPQFGDV
jgi:hypothetical protein